MPASPNPELTDEQLRLRTRRQKMLGEKLRWHRTERRMTQERLAHDAHMSRSNYIEVETGHRGIQVDRLWEICDAMDGLDAGILLSEVAAEIRLQDKRTRTPT